MKSIYKLKMPEYEEKYAYLYEICEQKGRQDLHRNTVPLAKISITAENANDSYYPSFELRQRQQAVY